MTKTVKEKLVPVVRKEEREADYESPACLKAFVALSEAAVASDAPQSNVLGIVHEKMTA